MAKIKICIIPVIKSARLYLWPAIVLNSLIMTICVNNSGIKGFWLGISLSMVTSFGFIFNDLCDRKIDRYNQSLRLEMVGKETIIVAVFIAVGFLLSGLLIGYQIHERTMLFLMVIICGLIFYSLLGRKFLFFANLLAAYLGVSPLWGPLLIFRVYENFYVFSVFSMLLLLVAREIFLDLKDRHGDERGGRNTIVTIFGVRVATICALLLILSGGIIELVIIKKFVNIQYLLKWILYLIVLLITSMSFIPAFRIFSQGSHRKNFRLFIASSGISMNIVPLLFLIYYLFK